MTKKYILNLLIITSSICFIACSCNTKKTESTNSSNEIKTNELVENSTTEPLIVESSSNEVATKETTTKEPTTAEITTIQQTAEKTSVTETTTIKQSVTVEITTTQPLTTQPTTTEQVTTTKKDNTQYYNPYSGMPCTKEEYESILAWEKDQETKETTTPNRTNEIVYNKKGKVDLKKTTIRNWNDKEAVLEIIENSAIGDYLREHNINYHRIQWSNNTLTNTYKVKSRWFLFLDKDDNWLLSIEFDENTNLIVEHYD